MSRLSPERWKVASPFLDRALEMPAGDRRSWLQSLRAEDATLAADVEALLDVRDAASRDGFLDQGALPPEPSSLAGQVLGAYTLESKIGQGGMGGVWLARRSDGRFEGRAAVKLLNAGLVGRIGEERFRREGSILARLTHEHIARLVDAGVSSGGQPYLVLEHVEGEQLDRYCDARSLGVEARIRLFLDVLASVEHAHANLIVHRDIKPSNVLVRRDGQVKLLDFGIAKLIEPETDGEATALTREGGQALTPEYAAPEQLAGGPVTTASDVHALGVLLYVLLVGRHPFADAVRSRVELLQRITESEPRRPSDAVVEGAAATVAGMAQLRGTTPDRLRRLLKGDLDTIVAKALKKRSQDRYTSVTAFADDLRRALNHQPISARPDTLRYRVAQMARRHRRGVAAAAATFLLFLGLVGFYTARLAAERDRARQEAERAARLATVAGDQAQRAEAVRRFLVGVFERARPDENRGRALSAHQLLERGEEQIGGSLGAQPALRADVTALLGELYGEISDFPRSQALLTRALADSNDPRVPADVRARVLAGVAAMEDENEAYDQARAHAQQALALLEGSAAGSAEEIANAHQIVTDTLIGQGDSAGAEAKLRQALREDGARLGESSESVGTEWVQLGVALGNLGRYRESEAAFQNGIRIFRALYGEDSHHVAHALNELSNMLEDEGDLAGAESALRRALKIRLQTVGPDHHDTLAGEHNLLVVVEYRGHYAEALRERLVFLKRTEGNSNVHPLDRAAFVTALGVEYRELGHLREAEAALLRALATIDRSQGPRSPRRTNTMHHLGQVLALAGRYREAEATLREALAIQKDHDPETAPVMAVRRSDLGHVLRLEHRRPEALRELQQAAEALGQPKDARDRVRPVVLAELSEAQLEAGDARVAESSAQSALDYARKALPPGHVHLGAPLFALARAERALQRPQAAEALLDEALAARTPCYPPDDLRVLEVQVELAADLALLGRAGEADALRREIRPRLKASASPYAADLLGRMAVGVRSGS